MKLYTIFTLLLLVTGVSFADSAAPADYALSNIGDGLTDRMSRSSYPDTVVATVIVGNNPNGIVSLPSGNYVYVTNYYHNTVSVIRTSDNTVVTTVNVGGGPQDVCSLPSGDYVYVVNGGDDNVSVVRTSDNNVVTTVDVGDSPRDICSLPSGEYVYVTSYFDDSVSVIRTSDNTVVATVAVGNYTTSICTLPSGDYVYVVNGGDDNVSVIRTSDNTVVATVDVGDEPQAICSLPSGDYVYVTNFKENNVSVIRTSDNTVVTTVNVGIYPFGICSLPSGDYVYVSNGRDDNVSIIRTSDNTVVATVTVGDSPSDICSLPSGDYVYVVNGGDNSVSVIGSLNPEVILPDSSTVWRHLNETRLIEWQNFPGSDVSVVLYNGASIVATLWASTANDGSCSSAGPIPSDWAEGTQYRIYIEDNAFYSAYSDYFEVRSGTGAYPINELETVAVGDNPYGICSLPSGDFVYVTNSDDDNVSVIRTSDNSVVATVAVGDFPFGICSLSSGDYVYVTNTSDDNVSVIRTSDNTVVATVPVGYIPRAICSLPSGDCVYVTNLLDDNVSVIGFEVLEVTLPDSATTWTHYDENLPIEWQQFSGTNVSVVLYNGASVVDTLTASTTNDGSWSYAGPVPSSWTAGTQYRIYIEDDLANSAFSDYFSVVESSNAEVITVSAPTSATEWLHYETNTEVTWSYPALLSLMSNPNAALDINRDGSPVSNGNITINLYKGGVLVDTYASAVTNNGSYTRTEGIPASWGTGTDYTLKVYDENGNYGWSEAFAVSTAEVITITEPTAITEWVYYSTDNSIAWDTTGLSGTTLDIVLYKDSVLVDTLVAGTDNDGSYIYPDVITDAWAVGSDYQLKIVDNYGDWGWSASFSVVESSGAEVITVTSPTSETYWIHYETDTEVTWSYPTILSSDSIKIDLYDYYEVFVGNYADWTANDGSYIRSEGIDPSWPGDEEYKIKVYDESGNYGWSEFFEIDIYEDIEITEPTALTEWMHYSTDNAIEWDTTGLLSTTVDIKIANWYTMVFEDIVIGTANDGSFTFTDAIPTWSADNRYYIWIKDNYGDEGITPQFSIIPSSGQELITVITPDTWDHYEENTTVDWSTPATEYGNITIDLYKGGVYVDNYGEYLSNTGSYTRTEGIPASWGTGTDYTLKVYDENGNYGWSEAFSISTIEIIVVTEPTSSTTWSRTSSNHDITWEVTGLTSTTVDIYVYKSNMPYAQLAVATANDGSWIYPGPVPADWLTGSDYRIKIVDNFSDWGWSEEFSLTGEANIAINYPTTGTVWNHYQKTTLCLWTNPADNGALFEDSVYIEIWKDGVYIHDYTDDWVPNKSRFKHKTPLPGPLTLPGGSNYQLKVIDEDGNYGYSNYFTINSGNEIINVFKPDSMDIWTTGEEKVLVAWVFTTTLESPLSGDSISMEIYKDGIYTGDVTGGYISNWGFYKRSAAIPASWGTGIGYQIKVMDELGNWGWSQEFYISSGEDVINVSKPDSSTVWYHYLTRTYVIWNYGISTGTDEGRDEMSIFDSFEPLGGDSVIIKVYKGGIYVDDYSPGWVPNTNYYKRIDFVSPGWGTGSDFRIRVEDNLGNYGWGENFTIGSKGEGDGGGVGVFELLPITPNPAAGTFSVNFSIPSMTHVNISIYDLTGRLAATPLDSETSAGTYSIRVNNLPTGTYFCRMQAGGFVDTRQVVVIR